MRKSILSKISGYSSILNSVSPNLDQNIQILRISLKKQIDRKEKLQKLMEKYDQITAQQKGHIKAIKASIIQLKDLQSKCKTKFYLNPIIYVDNHIAKQTRQYLCMLLNTFYSKYDQNFQCEHKTKILGKQMNQLLESLSKNQQNLLKLEKQTIGVQVQLQGQLLSYKTRLKDQGQRQKQLQDQNKRITTICKQFEQKYKTQLDKVIKLRDCCKMLEERISLLKDKVAEGELIKKGKEEMMANQIAYQQKFHIQLENIDQEIKKQQERQSHLKQKIKQKKLKVELNKNKYNKLCSSLKTNDEKNIFTESNGRQLQIYDQNAKKNVSPQYLSLTCIKKYDKIIDQLKTAVEMSKTSFFDEKRSKDLVNYQVDMKIVEMRTESSWTKRKERTSVR